MWIQHDVSDRANESKSFNVIGAGARHGGDECLRGETARFSARYDWFPMREESFRCGWVAKVSETHTESRQHAADGRDAYAHDFF